MTDRIQPWRQELPVLVAEAQTLGSVAVIRSLGRAGYPVHAMCARQDAIGFFSSYTKSRVCCPDYDDPGIADWLLAYVAQHGIRTIIPSEGLLLAMRARFSEFAPLMPIPQEEKTVYSGLSKWDLFHALLAPAASGTVGAHLPPTLLVDENHAIPSLADLAELGNPLYLKVDGCHARRPARGNVYCVADAKEAAALIGTLLRDFRKVLVQGHVRGRGVGAFFVTWDGRVLAEFMHRRLHEVPYTGGVSSFRESWFHAAIRDDAMAKLKHMGWQGAAMMEYRAGPSPNEFYLMEMNGRFWGSLHLALWAGVDFPRVLVDAMHGRRQEPITAFRVGVKCRHTFPAEIQHVWSRIKDGRRDPLGALWSLAEFPLLCANPSIHSDLLFPGDRRLYWINLKRFAKDCVDSVGRRLLRSR